ncbi:bacteriohemerythrin [Thalassotalea sp. PLHSN55]|uniref:bacteriohemerythrin n=1 Tax=Thalassotalea sp. PLHSN55 TaxID=3435888 RepID=UPI003F84EACF
MTRRIKALIYAAIVCLVIVAIFLGFLSGFDNVISWILIIALVLVSVLYKKNKNSHQIQWKDEYSVGVQILDDDHKKLVQLLNQFTTAYDYAMSESFERQALEDLVDYTKTHFSREEKIMEENDYPDIVAHKEQHKKMIAQVETFVDLYNIKGHDALDEVSTFLSKWLINHINGTDKQYTKHLNDRGVA